MEDKNKKLMLMKNKQRKLVDLQCALDLFKKELKEKKELLESAHCYSNSLEERISFLEKENSEPLVARTAKAFNSNIRRIVYSQLICDVPVKNCGYLIKFFSKVMCGKDIVHTPSPATCAQMAYELGILSSIQATEFMLSHDSICLSWDATSVDGAHYNEIHITVDRSKCMVLDVRHIAGGKTSDYVTHISSTLLETADIYARYVGKQPCEIFNALKARISSTLTDRAAVNGAVTRQLHEQFESDLIQLNCNLHPLDSVARQSKMSLKQLDERYGVQGQCYGSEGTAANLINAVSVLRFKDGTGDPTGFKNMLRHHRCKFTDDEVQNRLIEIIIVATPLADFQKELRTKPQTYTLDEALQLGRSLTIDPNVPARIDPPRKVPIALKDKIKLELNNMCKKDVIRQIKEPTSWASSLTYVTKQDGSLRTCLDPKHLNRVLLRPHHRIPTVEELNHEFAGAKYFSKLDANSRYWFLKLHPKSQPLTTFQTLFGRYFFNAFLLAYQ